MLDAGDVPSGVHTAVKAGHCFASRISPCVTCVECAQHLGFQDGPGVGEALQGPGNRPCFVYVCACICGRSRRCSMPEKFHLASHRLTRLASVCEFPPGVMLSECVQQIGFP